MINISHCNGSKFDTNLQNISFKDLTGLVDWLCAGMSVGDKGSNGYLLRCTGKKRGNDSVDDVANLLILDGDKHYTINGTIEAGAISPDYVHEVLKYHQISHYIYPSHSNNPPNLNRYRVLIPSKYHRNQLDGLLDFVFDILHKEEAMLVDVKENHTWAQAWFKFCVPPVRNQPFWDYCYFDGKPFDVEQITAAYEKTKQKSPVSPVIHVQPKQITTLSSNPIIEFNANHSVNDILIRNGYRRIGKRYLHPNSQSKVAGVRILNNGNAYSDSNDVLNDFKSHDAFDCFRLLECDGDFNRALSWNSDINRANQRAFYDTQNPHDAGLRYSVQLPSFENSQGSQAQNFNR